MNVAEKCYDQSGATGETSNLAKELDRLVQLREAGVLSEEEFKAAKAKLLAGCDFETQLRGIQTMRIGVI